MRDVLKVVQQGDDERARAGDHARLISRIDAP